MMEGDEDERAMADRMQMMHDAEDQGDDGEGQDDEDGDDMDM